MPHELPYSAAMRTPLTLIRVPHAAAAAAAAADLLYDLAPRAATARGHFSLALSGGRTPLALFRLLADPANTGRMPWEKTLAAWVDERCVPESHPESNYGEALRAGLPLNRIAAVLRPDTELEPERAAEEYARALLAAFACAPGTMPVFDALLLGMGDDGHTASLFPGSGGLRVTDKAAIAQYPPGKTPRLTLTLPVLNAARTRIFLVTGAEKHSALCRALDPAAKPELPVQMIRPERGETFWIADEAALSGKA